VRGDVLEVESFETGAVVARVPCPRSLVAEPTPVTRQDSRAWATTIGPHLYFWALRGREAAADEGLLSSEVESRRGR
jgi:hypothetical protein